MVETYVIRKKTVSWIAANGKRITFTSRKRVKKCSNVKVKHSITFFQYLGDNPVQLPNPEDCEDDVDNSNEK